MKKKQKLEHKSLQSYNKKKKDYQSVILGTDAQTLELGVLGPNQVSSTY